MSQQFSDLMQQYRAVFNDMPTICGFSDEDAVRLMKEALKTGKPIPDFPETEDGSRALR